MTQQIHEILGNHARGFGRLNQSQLPLGEQLKRESAVNTEFEEQIVEWDCEDRGSAMFGDHGQVALLGLAQQFAGTLPQIANAKGL